MTFRTLTCLVLVLLVLCLPGCVTNPVTGERNFQLYGSDWEQQAGAQMYAPMKQSQGGEFILDPQLTEYINTVGQRLASRARRKDLLQFEFSILNNSTPNAWALPGGKIVVNRGLLTELGSEAELAAVLGHEIVHADAAHGAQQQSSGMLAQLGTVASMVVLGSTVENPAAREVAMMVPTVGAQLIMQRYGRDAERESDEYGMRYMSEAGYDPQGAIELQKTFVKLSESRNEDWLSGLFASHPPSRERVENNQQTAATLPAGGDMGRERYLSRTAFLRRVKPAYAAYDEAVKAVSENQLDVAQQKLDQALAIEPRESLFLALQGDLQMQRKQPDKALANFDRASQANPGYFYSWLRKGQAQYELSRTGLARTSLEKSLALLPTSQAHYLVGLMDRENGHPEKAVEHFKVAAQSASAAGQSAQRELILLDLGKNPSAYISVEGLIDRAGVVWVQIGNKTSVPLRNIDMKLVWLDDQGQTKQQTSRFDGPLAGGKAERYSTGLKFGTTADITQRFRVTVTSAALVE